MEKGRGGGGARWKEWKREEGVEKKTKEMWVAKFRRKRKRVGKGGAAGIAS